MAKTKKRWRDAWASTETIQRVRPIESNDYLPNPHRGTTTFQRFQGDALYPTMRWSDTYGPVSFKPSPQKIRANKDYIPHTTLTYCRWPWRFLETKKGKFNWKIIDGTLKAAKDRGQLAQLRFQPFTGAVVQPEEKILCRRRPNGPSVDVPDWFWDTGCKWLPNKKGPAEPDANDPLYIKHFSEFIRAFAKRYDGHPIIESIDIAYAGHFGEMGGNANNKTASKLIDVYLRSFKKTQLVSMLGTKGCAYIEKKKPGLAGWRADCYGDLRMRNITTMPKHLAWNHMYDAYPSEIFGDGVQDVWKTAPVTFETCGTVASWDKGKHDIDWIIEQGYKYHLSVFMPKSVYFPKKWMSKLIEFDKKIGYRFVLRQMLLNLEGKVGQKIPIQVFIDNVGCAPIYRPYKLALRFTQGKTEKIVTFKKDIKSFMPGVNFFKEAVVLPKGLKKGEASLDLAIVDEENNLVVRFANKGLDKQGWLALTKIDIL